MEPSDITNDSDVILLEFITARLLSETHKDSVTTPKQPETHSVTDLTSGPQDVSGAAELSFTTCHARVRSLRWDEASQHQSFRDSTLRTFILCLFGFR